MTAVNDCSVCQASTVESLSPQNQISSCSRYTLDSVALLMVKSKQNSTASPSASLSRCCIGTPLRLMRVDASGPSIANLIGASKNFRKNSSHRSVTPKKRNTPIMVACGIEGPNHLKPDCKTVNDPYSRIFSKVSVLSKCNSDCFVAIGDLDSPFSYSDFSW